MYLGKSEVLSLKACDRAAGIKVYDYRERSYATFYRQKRFVSFRGSARGGRARQKPAVG
jgi:hypothetical protein